VTPSPLTLRELFPRDRIRTDLASVDIGISKAGIDYDAGDGKPVYLAFMIVSPRRNPEVHLQTLKLLAEALELAGFAEALIQAADSDAAFHVIEKFEGLLGCA
jgi:PTS system fructose-specific IIC component/PTS system nitrogen regulatory IIA component